jgi:hypothetical protein
VKRIDVTPLCARSKGKISTLPNDQGSREPTRGHCAALCRAREHFSAGVDKKISIKYLFMRDGVGHWLVSEFPIRGLHLQNWMVVAAAIVVLWVVYLWLGGWLRRQD